MAQAVSQSVPNGSGASFRSNSNTIFAALFSSSSGATAPTTTVAGQLWFDTGSTPAVLKRRNSANDGWDKVNPGLTVTNKAAGYTAVEADRNSVIRCTSVVTIAFDPAASLGGDWSTIIMATGGAVTLDPDSSETINGAGTLTLSNGDSAFVFCDGSVLYAIVSKAENIGFDPNATWQDVLSSRSGGTTYQNTTDYAIQVSIWMSAATGKNAEVSTDNFVSNQITVGRIPGTNALMSVSFTVLPGHYYRIDSGAPSGWAELR